MVRVPVVDPVTVRGHDPADRVQNPGPRETVPVPDCVKVTVPVGDAPETVAVHREVDLTANEVGVQATVVEVTAFVTARLAVFELAASLLSPG